MSTIEEIVKHQLFFEHQPFILFFWHLEWNVQAKSVTLPWEPTSEGGCAVPSANIHIDINNNCICC